MTRDITRWRRIGRWRWRVEWKTADLWIGLYLSKDETWRSGSAWVCLVPCLPVHVQWWPAHAPGDKNEATS